MGTCSMRSLVIASAILVVPRAMVHTGDMGVDTVEDVTAVTACMTAVEDGAEDVVAKNEVSTIFSPAPHPRTFVINNSERCLAVIGVLFIFFFFSLPYIYE